MDGVLVDSEPLWRRAEIDVFGEVGLRIDEQDCLETQGLRIDAAVAYWFERHPWPGPSPSDVADSIVARVAGLIRSEGCLLPGVHDSLDWATKSGWRLALASSSPKRLIETCLDHFGIEAAFEITRSAELEPFGKPHPGVYLSTARDLGIQPAACIAIEDSLNGIRSALAAGMRCIAVPPPESRDDARFDLATLRLESLNALPEALRALA